MSKNKKSKNKNNTDKQWSAAEEQVYINLAKTFEDEIISAFRREAFFLRDLPTNDEKQGDNSLKEDVDDENSKSRKNGKE